MPPVKKFQRESIIDIAYEIVNNEGFDGVNARRIAKEMGCSVQPIFHNFSSMEELKGVVYEKIYEKYLDYMKIGLNEENAYKKSGLSYIRFAKDYPNFFKIIFMQKTDLSAEEFILGDNKGNNIIELGRKFTNFSYQKQKKFHVKVWIFTHGIACLVATNTIKLTEEEIEELLENTVREMLKRIYKGGEGLMCVVEVKNLTKEYKKIKAVDDLSFEVKQGEIIGLLGPNGSRKDYYYKLYIVIIKI